MYPVAQCLSNERGDVTITSISRAITIGTPTKDVTVGGGNSGKTVPFLIIPLTEGTIKVHFVGESSLDSYYTITEVEVLANIGQPMPYLVDKVIADGTTAQINIGL